jgi:hypothetical protein
MSFSAIASHSSNDKGSDSFGQSCNDLDADFFDQFLTFSPVDNEGSDYSLLPEATLLERSIRENLAGDTSSSLHRDGKTSIVREVGQQRAFVQKQALSHHASAQGGHFYSEVSGRAAISDSELLRLENINLHSPQFRPHSLPSRPSTPSPTATAIARRRTQILESRSKTLRRKPSGNLDKALRSPIRKTSYSPKMLRASQSYQNHHDIWDDKVNSKFQFDFEHPTGPLSPPQSARVSDASDASSSARFVRQDRHDLLSYTSGSLQQLDGRPAAYDTPLATPILDAQNSRRTSAQQPFQDIVHFPPTPQYQQASGTWPQIPGSSEFSTYGTSPEVDSPIWWNHASTPMVQPSPTAIHVNAQRATRSLARQLQNDLPYKSNDELTCSSTSKMPSGLMIQMPGSPSQQSFVVCSPHMQSPPMQQQGYFGHSQQQQRPRHNGLSRQYAAGAPTHGQHSSPTRKTRSTFSESASISPTPTTAGFSVRKRRTTKASKNTPRTPSTGTTTTVDFVNFTPDDSTKILTGVAPSGSSKTKARREKEAMEKRRKLSLAALRAVRAAGGDVESLVEQGLFV